jgi:predicted metal-dependent HD superfamily phosphohydrolase
MRHLRECLSLWTHWRQHCVRAEDVGLALWFRGAYYNPRKDDSEIRSAAYAARALGALGISFEGIQRVYDLVVATRPGTATRGADATLIADMSNAVLGSSPSRFAAHEQDLRRDQPWLPRSAYRTQRSAAFRHLLEQPRIFRSGPGFRLLEVQARGNLRAAIRRLNA